MISLQRLIIPLSILISVCMGSMETESPEFQAKCQEQLAKWKNMFARDAKVTESDVRKKRHTILKKIKKSNPHCSWKDINLWHKHNVKRLSRVGVKEIRVLAWLEQYLSRDLKLETMRGICKKVTVRTREAKRKGVTAEQAVKSHVRRKYQQTASKNISQQVKPEYQEEMRLGQQQNMNISNQGAKNENHPNARTATTQSQLARRGAEGSFSQLQLDYNDQFLKMKHEYLERRRRMKNILAKIGRANPKMKNVNKWFNKKVETSKSVLEKLNLSEVTDVAVEKWLIDILEQCCALSVKDISRILNRIWVEFRKHGRNQEA